MRKKEGIEGATLFSAQFVSFALSLLLFLSPSKWSFGCRQHAAYDMSLIFYRTSVTSPCVFPFSIRSLLFTLFAASIETSMSVTPVLVVVILVGVF